MTTELEMLTWATALTILLWIPYTLARIMNVGLLPTLTYKSDDTPLAAWAARAKKAHANAIENLAPFAVLVLVRGGGVPADGLRQNPEVRAAPAVAAGSSSGDLTPGFQYKKHQCGAAGLPLDQSA